MIKSAEHKTSFFPGFRFPISILFFLSLSLSLSLPISVCLSLSLSLSLLCLYLILCVREGGREVGGRGV